jgi:CheY-like chemotaxis protein/HD-like signal output (HDOD) protein
MNSILVVDDMAVFREPIAASLRLAGHQTLCAQDGEEALALCRKHLPNLILLDISMPKMDGITFLKHLRAEPPIANTRVILLTALSEKQHIMAAGSLGVKDYLLKSRFRLQELLERVNKYGAAAPGADSAAPASASAAVENANEPSAAAAPPPAMKLSDIPRLMTSEQFLARIEGVLQAKTLSGVVAQVIAVATSPRSDLAQLAGVIGKDSMLSARVLQTANSAAYATAGGSITTIQDAIRKIGCTTVRNLAAAIGVFDCVPEACPDGFNPIRCWQHSFAVAQLCERLVSVNMPEQAGLAYLVGLCHDLGEIITRTQFNAEHQQFRDALARSGLPMEDVHRQVFGLTPAEMSGAILKCLGLPEAIRKPIELFHSAAGWRVNNALVKILWMAENCANAALLASTPQSRVAPLSRPLCRGAVGSPNPPQPDPHVLRSEVLALTVALARLPRADEAKLTAPLLARHAGKVWIARAPGISEFDPIGMAFGGVLDAQVHDRLPDGREMQDVDGLVIVVPQPNVSGFADADVARCFTPAQNQNSPSVLAIVCDTPEAAKPGSTIPWQTALALSDVADFVEKLRRIQPPAAVA